MPGRRLLLLVLAAVLIIAAAFVGRMVFQPVPYAFAGGHQVDLGAYTGPSPTGVPPELIHVRAVNGPSGTNVIQMIFGGSGVAHGDRPYMPSFAAAYSDAEIAAVANYVTARFGSKPSRVKPKTVALLRLQR